jgi:peptide subunit release factor 1 (eRF1)
VENAQEQHTREVAEALQRIAREDGVTRIVIAGDSAIAPLLLEQLPKELREIADTMTLDVHAPENEVLQSTFEKIQDEVHLGDEAKVKQLTEQYRSGALAVAGPEATLQALANGQVDELLLSSILDKTNAEPVKIDAILAPEIPDSTGSTESDQPREVSLPDLLVAKAKQTGATITFVEGSAVLESIGGVGAFLRWRA